MARKRLETVVASSVRHLREVADQLEREAARGIENAAARTHDWSTYGYVAGQFVHTLANGVNNVSLSNMIDAAADADVARVEKNLKGFSGD